MVLDDMEHIFGWKRHPAN